MKKVTINSIEVEQGIQDQVRFLWGEQMTEKLPEDSTEAEIVLDNVLGVYHNSQKLIEYMDREIRTRFNKACDDYKQWVEKLGP